jgi:hypothetical protein
MTIDYQALIDAALLDIVRKILRDVQEEGLLENQSFYISFNTDYPGVVLSKRVKSLYPEEITIVLQYQYKDLKVFENKFSVNLAFGGVAETVQVPFLALTGFADPMAGFSLQFGGEVERDIEDDSDESEDDEVVDDATKFKLLKPQKTGARNSYERKAGEVISIDKFRKNPK